MFRVYSQFAKEKGNEERGEGWERLVKPRTAKIDGIQMLFDSLGNSGGY